ncbi:hypothetical protein FHS79_002665 [Polymorphobacter multimanifer]|uniref:PHP domain-containing protein n=1 Tax=Polymorphobacter multimanifer TaxID=1070431 RepID=A0A841LHN5_9SPHN|nr:CehA/McbA family metallohydrolase [Polymorphobacter multimanifer]MBB6228478.1 hypothetical protein [Polymorphobacter multimanifer]
MRALLLAMLLGTAAAAQNIQLTGTITAADHQSYQTHAFDVPPGVTRVDVTFTRTPEAGITIDLGMLEDGRPRGWSGSNKQRFSIGLAEATPSYTPGPVAGRRMALALGIPNARSGSTASWTATIGFSRDPATPPPPPPVVNPAPSAPGWLRGELHAHSTHSDGARPIEASLQAARAAGLDFISLTEHNTVSQLQALAHLQPEYPSLILLPGQEITTFNGHANLFGSTTPAPFMARDWPQTLPPGLLSINHPALPSGEICMGCGWTQPIPERATLVEAVNGSAIAAAGGLVETPISALPWWDAQLATGKRLIAIGGSDNHDASLAPPDPRAIGHVTTIVWAEARTPAALLKGLEAGHAFIQIGGPARMLDMTAGAAPMGSTASPGTPLRITVTDCNGCNAELIHQAKVIATLPITDGPLNFTPPENLTGPIRAHIRDSRGQLTLIGNPIWYHPPSRLRGGTGAKRQGGGPAPARKGPTASRPAPAADQSHP